MTPFTLHLLRHGEPEVAGRMLGRTDCGSTAAGIAACVEQVAGLEFDCVASSDLIRARAAAEAVAPAPQVDPRWRELDFGDWDGKASSEIDPTALGLFWDDPDANPPPSGERWSSLVDRVTAAIGGLTPVPTLVVTHGGAIRAALSSLCGFDHHQIWAFDLPYAALLSLTVWPGERAAGQIIGLR